MSSSRTMKTTARWGSRLALGLAAGMVALGCDGTDRPTVCQPGATQTCVCANLQKGAQSCNASGVGWDPCVCVTGPSPSATPERPGRPRPVKPLAPSPGARAECEHHRRSATTAGLVAWYTFDGHTCDVSPSHLDGVPTEAIRFDTDRVGTPKGAVVFTHRSEARIDLGEAKPLSALGNLFTVSYWVKISGEDGGIIINHDQLGTRTDDWTLGVHRAGEHAGRPYLTFGNPAATATVRVNDGEWHHVVVRRDQASASLDFFVDNRRHDHVLDPRLEGGGLSRDLTARCPTNLGPYRMPGRWADNGFKGSLDDLRIYRRLLSDAEIARLATEGRP